MQHSSFKRGQIGLRAGGLHLFSLLPCVWIAALCADNGGNSCEHQSDSCTPPPSTWKSFIVSICLRFLDSSQGASVYILDWSHFPSHFDRLEETRTASSCTISPVFCVSLSLYYSPSFIILLLKLNLTQQSGILD